MSDTPSPPEATITTRTEYSATWGDYTAVHFVDEGGPAPTAVVIDTPTNTGVQLVDGDGNVLAESQAIKPYNP